MLEIPKIDTTETPQDAQPEVMRVTIVAPPTENLIFPLCFSDERVLAIRRILSPVNNAFKNNRIWSTGTSVCQNSVNKKNKNFTLYSNANPDARILEISVRLNKIPDKSI